MTKVIFYLTFQKRFFTFDSSMRISSKYRTGICPICGEKHLVRAKIIDLGGIRENDAILCENEYYLHIKRGKVVFIARVVQLEKAMMKDFPLLCMN